MDWRYWITFEGKVRTDSDDENVARTAAMQDFNEREMPWANVEVEPLEGGEGA